MFVMEMSELRQPKPTKILSNFHKEIKPSRSLSRSNHFIRTFFLIHHQISELNYRDMDSLWKKTSNIAGSSYVNLFDNLRPGAANLYSVMAVMAPALRAELMCSYTQKSDESSVNYREQGNQKFQQKKWCEAMSCYNQSLCFAKIGSKNVSLAYANRSACFFRLKEYKRCLIDIELAEQAGFPSHLMPKLKERREHCLKSIETDGDSNEQFELELSYEPNKVLAGCADVLQIKVNKRLGRYVNASCDIPAGKTVLIEEPFIGRPGETRYKRCAACYKYAMNFIACSKCTNAIFCDTTCTTKNVHQMECNYSYNDSDKLELHLEFIAHSIFVAMSIFPDIQSLMEFVQDVVKRKSKTVPELLIDEKSKYRAFLQLSVFLSPTTLNECLQLGSDWFSNLMLREIIKKQFDTEEKMSFLMHLTVQHILIVSTNAYLPAPADARFLFIAASYFNHSCEPNVLRANYQNRLVFITIRPVQAGEQLYIRYNELIDGEPVARRQAHFMEKYGFQCKCERCESAVPSSLIDMYTKGLARDPDYQLVLNEIGQEPDLNLSKAKLMSLQSKCIDLLNRFGNDHWFPALGTLTGIFTQIYKKILNPHDENVGFNWVKK